MIELQVWWLLVLPCLALPFVCWRWRVALKEIDVLTKDLVQQAVRPTVAILSLPRHERRAMFHVARRKDKSLDWHEWRRWDGGKPNILTTEDLLKAKGTKKKSAQHTGNESEQVG